MPLFACCIVDVFTIYYNCAMSWRCLDGAGKSELSKSKLEEMDASVAFLTTAEVTHDILHSSVSVITFELLLTT
jgi:hypothetical protein